MRRLVVACGLAALAIAGCAFDDPAGGIDGIWQLTEFGSGGDTVEVAVGVNAATTPWLRIEEGRFEGTPGCNRYSGGLHRSGDTLTIIGGMATAKACGEGDGLMQSEQAFDQVAFQAPHQTIAVFVTGDRMVWKRQGAELVFGSVETPPTTATAVPEPVQRVRGLDCSPGFVQFTEIPDEGQTPLEVAQQVAPRVVDIITRQPLLYTGVDADGEVVAELSLGDVSGTPYTVATCEAR